VALVRTDVSEERIVFIIRVTTICELGTTLAVTSNRITLHAANVAHSSLILVTLMIEAMRSSETSVDNKKRAHVTSQNDGILHSRRRETTKCYVKRCLPVTTL
jgi:hypothetical protein